MTKTRGKGRRPMPRILKRALPQGRTRQEKDRTPRFSDRQSALAVLLLVSAMAFAYVAFNPPGQETIAYDVPQTPAAKADVTRNAAEFLEAYYQHNPGDTEISRRARVVQVIGAEQVTNLEYQELEFEVEDRRAQVESEALTREASFEVDPDDPSTLVLNLPVKVTVTLPGGRTDISTVETTTGWQYMPADQGRWIVQTYEAFVREADAEGSDALDVSQVNELTKRATGFVESVYEIGPDDTSESRRNRIIRYVEPKARDGFTLDDSAGAPQDSLKQGNLTVIGQPLTERIILDTVGARQSTVTVELPVTVMITKGRQSVHSYIQPTISEWQLRRSKWYVTSFEEVGVDTEAGDSG